MKAVICGTGIAGLALATRLAQANWSVTVLETAPALRGEGYMIDLFGSGFEAAERMGLMPRVRELGYEFEAIRWLNAAGRTRARLTYRALRNLFEGRFTSVVRGDLERIILERLPPAVELRFSSVVDQVRTPVGAVEAHLVSGEVVSGDVLIGADGLRSRIRDLVFGESAAWFRFLGFHTAACIVDAPDIAAQLRNELHVLSVPSRQVGLYPLRDGKVAVFFIHRAVNSGPPPSAMEALQTAYGDLGGPVPAILEHARALPSLMYENVGQVVMSHWRRGRIALLGDACQAVSLLPGQGASLSLAAAYVLSEELCSDVPVKEALERYEHRVRPSLVRMRRSGRRVAEWLVPATSAGLVTRDATIRLANLTGLSRLLVPLVNAAHEDVLTAQDHGAPRPQIAGPL